MFEQIRQRPAPLKHIYVKRPAYIITEAELQELTELMAIAFRSGKRAGRRQTEGNKWISQ